MNCPSCGAEILEGSNLCPKCNPTALDSSIAGAPATPSSGQSSKSALWLGRIGAWLLSLACCYMVVIFAAMRTARVYHPSKAEAAGFFFGACIVNFLIPLIGVALYYRKRTPRPPIHRRALAICGLAVALSLLTYRGSSYSSANLTEQRLATLAKEGAGLLPVSPDESVWDAPARSFFADVVKYNRDYIAEADALDRSALASLYGTDSFKSRQGMQRVLSQLRAVEAVDAKYGNIAPLLDSMKNRIRALEMPESEKEDFLRGFTSSAGDGLAKRGEVAAKEQSWMQASIDLYEFAIAKKSSYMIQGKTLVFGDQQALSEFNARMEKAQALKSEFLKAKDNFDNWAHGYLGKMDLKPSDLGAPTEIPAAQEQK